MTFDEFLRNVCPSNELVWRKYRRRSARHHVRERMQELGLAKWEDYLERLHQDPVESGQLAELMRVTVTRFFRDRECWNELATSVSSILSDGRRTLQAWSAGCCGGEEPFSLAILWLHRLAATFPQTSLDITATDIDLESLARAASAAYALPELREVPEELREAWFERVGRSYRPLPAARSMVTFRRHHFLADPPPGMFDLVLCRYLPFTYYSGKRLEAAVAVLAGALRRGGILMIGIKETLPSEAAALFEPVGKTGALWKKL